MEYSANTPTLNRRNGIPKAVDIAASDTFSIKEAPDFDRGKPDPSAEGAHELFRLTVAGSAFTDSRGVLYDESVISTYIRTKYPAIKARHEAHMQAAGLQIPAGFDWMIAFYWAALDKGPIRKLSFEVVPVLANKTTGEVFDYFNPPGDYYNKQTSATDPENVYDEGHLWP
jgi:hypothetical protein